MTKQGKGLRKQCSVWWFQKPSDWDMYWSLAKKMRSLIAEKPGSSRCKEAKECWRKAKPWSCVTSGTCANVDQQQSCVASNMCARAKNVITSPPPPHPPHLTACANQKRRTNPPPQSSTRKRFQKMTLLQTQNDALAGKIAMPCVEKLSRSKKNASYLQWFRRFDACTCTQLQWEKCDWSLLRKSSEGVVPF